MLLCACRSFCISSSFIPLRVFGIGGVAGRWCVPTLDLPSIITIPILWLRSSRERPPSSMYGQGASLKRWSGDLAQCWAPVCVQQSRTVSHHTTTPNTPYTHTHTQESHTSFGCSVHAPSPLRAHHGACSCGPPVRSVRALPAGKLIHKHGEEALGPLLLLSLFLLRRALRCCWRRGRRRKGDAHNLKVRTRKM